jgi:hypothetical protein
MKAADRFELFRRLRELDPKPTTELNYRTPFELLVAVILSAQATDVGVNKATAQLFPIARTPKAILALGETGLKRYIRTIGLFNRVRVRAMACKLLLLLGPNLGPLTGIHLRRGGLFLHHGSWCRRYALEEIIIVIIYLQVCN